MPKPNLVEIGDNIYYMAGNQSTVMVAFTGSVPQATGSPFAQLEFAHSIERLQWQGLLLRDPQVCWYQHGISSDYSTPIAVAELINKVLKEFSPGAVKVFAGESAGGYAALLFGHLCKANKVHAFAPQTDISPEGLARHNGLYTGAQRKIEGGNQAFWRLREVINEWNGVTQYYIHACCRELNDLYHAEDMLVNEHIEVMLRDCETHSLGSLLKSQGLLLDILQGPKHD